MDPGLRFPAGFDVLMGEVDSLGGQGGRSATWGRGRCGSGKGWRRTRLGVACLGLMAMSLSSFVWRGVGTSVELECGAGPETICFVAYCRQEGAGKEWQWRYGAEHGQYGILEVLNNVLLLLV
ncbi:uncharacterized protein F4812DRAFT_429807 [Daldinia caldariorum]|uniref:uncharacterized protein n=1 Tax=Daldinia caldariorum TaxID=326644 RepID=UPI0020072978|nr:uncharacterized protein F4812DRAFT_429807 [Daldinia caldariorum]KAI1467503.1 hypothetical protein F4812DRAFT_429807 [Daldinia caldariorum]